MGRTLQQPAVVSIPRTSDATAFVEVCRGSAAGFSIGRTAHHIVTKLGPSGRLYSADAEDRLARWHPGLIRARWYQPCMRLIFTAGPLDNRLAMRKSFSVVFRLSLLALFFHSVVHAQVIDIEVVDVDDIGNDPQELFEGVLPESLLLGGVDYDFRIAKYETTNEEYAAFLNAVDPDGTGYGDAVSTLYGKGQVGAFLDVATGILLKPENDKGARWEVRMEGAQSWARKPVAHVGWTMAARFVNWLHNGQPVLNATPDELQAAVTENGAYDLSAPFPQRRAGARWWIPSANEWQKAAFYDPTLDNGVGGYWLFPTRSNGTDSLLLPTDFDENGVGLPTNGGDSANQRRLEDGLLIPRPTDVGTNGNPSYYGTFDQAGNVEEWLDDIHFTFPEEKEKRLFIGGSWSGNPNAIWQKRYGATAAFALEDQEPGPSSVIGFRVASRPPEEPVIAAAFVQVGNLGNAAIDLENEPALGSVAYPFAIGVHEVTNAQFADFLNKVYPDAEVGDPRVPFFWGVPFEDDLFRRGIVFDAEAVPGERFQVFDYFSNKPVNFVSWFDAARYVNWLHHGAPTFPGVEDALASGVTESGAYVLPDPNAEFDENIWRQIVRQAGARYWLPSEDEWVKAAYYDPTLNNGNGGYWRYAVRSQGFYEPDDLLERYFFNPGLQGSFADSIGRGVPRPRGPRNEAGELEDEPGNSANRGGIAFWNVVGNVTTVGSNGRPSHYGTYDQDGNVREWNETVFTADNQVYRGCRGSSFSGGQSGHFQVALVDRAQLVVNMGLRNSLTGFRVAGVAGTRIQRLRLQLPRVLVFGSSCPLRVGSSSSLPVVARVTGNPEVARIANGRLHILKAGPFQVTLTQAGDSVWAKQTQTFNLRAAKRPQTLSLRAPRRLDVLEADAPPLTWHPDNQNGWGVRVSSGLPFVVASSNPEIVEVSRDGAALRVRPKKEGRAVIIVTQPGNDNFAPARPVRHILQVGAAGGRSARIPR